MVGFVGLGNMGQPMALNLVKKDFKIIAFDLRRECVELLATAGAHAAGSVAEVARQSDIILMSLPSPAASWAVFSGDGGLLANAHPGTIFVELSTISPSQARSMAEQASAAGMSLLDAGISGGVPSAVQGKLTIMVGGSQEIFQKAQPYLKAIGENIYYVGSSGTGMVVKLVNNAIAHVNVVAAIEGMALGVKAGVSAETLAEIIRKGTGRSYQFESRIAERLLKRNLQPGMKLELTYKDSRLACEMANELGVPLFVTAAAHSVFQYGMSLGLQESDYVAIAQIWEDALDIKIEEGKAD
jgi:2-hydroxymethylglutarate dehydrogenase